MYKISVIMPIYNVEEFIDEAITSVINQTMKFDDIELLLIDDCSKDDSGKIANSYAEKYDNVIYYRLEKNSGMAGKPRNIAIGMAHGEYLMFLDPDDLYYPDACEAMYNCINEQKVNFVSAEWRKTDINKNPIEDTTDGSRSRTIFTSDPLKATEVLKHSSSLKIIKRQFIVDSNIRYLEGVPSEDAYFTSKMFLESKKAYFLDKQIVLYRQRTTGNVSETFRLNENFFERTMLAKKAIHELFSQYNEIAYFKCYYAESIFYYIERLFTTKDLESFESLKNLFVRSEEFFDLWNTFGFPKNMEEDKYDLLKIFDYNNLENLEDYLKSEQIKLQNEDIWAVKSNIKDIVSKIKEDI